MITTLTPSQINNSSVYKQQAEQNTNNTNARINGIIFLAIIFQIMYPKIIDNYNKIEKLKGQIIEEEEKLQQLILKELPNEQENTDKDIINYECSKITDQKYKIIDQKCKIIDQKCKITDQQRKIDQDKNHQITNSKFKKIEYEDEDIYS